MKNPPAMQETWVRYLGQEDPLEEGMVTHSSILAWRIPMDRGARGGYSHGVAKSQTRTKRLSKHSPPFHILLRVHGKALLMPSSLTILSSSWTQLKTVFSLLSDSRYHLPLCACLWVYVSDLGQNELTGDFATW